MDNDDDTNGHTVDGWPSSERTKRRRMMTGNVDDKACNDGDHRPLHQRYLLTVSYDGTRFKGFQRQTSSNTATTTATTTGGNEPSSVIVDKKTLRKNKMRRHDYKSGGFIPVSVTVQELLEDAFELYASSLLASSSSQETSSPSKIQQWDRNLLRMRFAGRTDAGVHARGQVVAVNLPLLDQPFWKIRRAMNARLPVDISIERVGYAPNQEFDPRKEATQKRYSYTVRYRRQVLLESSSPNSSNATSNTQENHSSSSSSRSQSHANSMLSVCTEGGPNLLRTALDPMNGRCWIVPWSLNDTNLESYSHVLTGTHDYSAFVHKSSREESDHNNNQRTVDSFSMERIQTVSCDGAPICDVRFTVAAKGFGRNQVRFMIGFLIDLCRGNGSDVYPDVQPSDSGEKVSQWLWNGEQDYDKLAARIQKAPACGLVLEEVTF